MIEAAARAINNLYIQYTVYRIRLSLFRSYRGHAERTLRGPNLRAHGSDLS